MVFYKSSCTFLYSSPDSGTSNSKAGFFNSVSLLLQTNWLKTLFEKLEARNKIVKKLFQFILSILFISTTALMLKQIVMNSMYSFCYLLIKKYIFYKIYLIKLKHQCSFNNFFNYYFYKSNKKQFFFLHGNSAKLFSSQKSISFFL